MYAKEASKAEARLYQDIVYNRQCPAFWLYFLLQTLCEAKEFEATCTCPHAVWSFNIWLHNNNNDVMSMVVSVVYSARYSSNFPVQWHQIVEQDFGHLKLWVPEALFHRTRLSLLQPQLIL